MISVKVLCQGLFPRRYHLAELNMSKLAFTVATSALISFSSSLAARPYPGISGLTATADNALTAGTNPAGISRLKERSPYLFGGGACWIWSSTGCTMISCINSTCE